jgi:membrane protease YdiL (CAAX protease family)
MENDINKAIQCLKEQSRRIFFGDYSGVKEIYSFQNKDQTTEDVSELIENFGLMAVKLEAREIDLVNKIDELEKQQAELKRLSILRSDSTYIFVNLLSIICVFTFVLVLIQRIHPQTDNNLITFFTSRIMEVIFIGIFIIYIYKRKMPLSGFGINTINLKKSILVSLAVTIIVIALISITKYFLIQFGIMEQQPILSIKFLNWTYLTYIIIAPLQEFVSRGIGQTSVERVLTGKNNWLGAIIVTALTFGMLHLTFSVLFAALSFVGSLIWGYLFYRHKNLAGISISHFIIGIWLAMSGFFH